MHVKIVYGYFISVRKFQPARVPADFQRAKVLVFYREKDGALIGVNAREFFKRPYLVARVKRYVPLDKVPRIQPDLYSYPPTEKKLTAPSLRGHIVNSHLSPDTFAVTGLPIFDLELLLFHGWHPDPIIKKIYEKLLTDDTELQKDIDSVTNLLSSGKLHFFNPCSTNRHDVRFTVIEYRRMLIKTLLYIEQLRLGVVDWALVETAYQGAKKLGIVPNRDFYESFFVTPALCEEVPRSFSPYPVLLESNSVWGAIDTRVEAYARIK